MRAPMNVREGGFKIEPVPLPSVPPGTLDKNPRMPRPPPVPHRQVPPMPPKSERKGKWLRKYFDSLDPETEFDEIIKVANQFSLSEFNINLGYLLTNLLLYQAQAAIAGFHTGHEALSQPHRRYYETANASVIWFSGSNHPDTIKRITQINKLHRSVWAKSGRGTGAELFGFHMALVSTGYLENYMRKLCGANEMGPALKAAYPLWAEQICKHFTTEPEDGSRIAAIDFPNNWKDYEDFFNFYITAIDWPSHLGENTEYRSLGHQLAVVTVDQFVENCTPNVPWLGRQLVYTLTPPIARKTLLLPEPNAIAKILVLGFFRFAFFMADNFPDPVEPVSTPLEEKLATLRKTHFNNIDEQVREEAAKVRKLYFNYLLIILAITVLLSALLVRFVSGL